MAMQSRFKGMAKAMKEAKQAGGVKDIYTSLKHGTTIVRYNGKTPKGNDRRAFDDNP